MFLRLKRDAFGWRPVSSTMPLPSRRYAACRHYRVPPWMSRDLSRTAIRGQTADADAAAVDRWRHYWMRFRGSACGSARESPARPGSQDIPVPTTSPRAAARCSRWNRSVRNKQASTLSKHQLGRIALLFRPLNTFWLIAGLIELWNSCGVVALGILYEV